jgi:valyl-tRNA synthetase
MRTLAGLACLTLVACAQVPQQSVELSNTLGRDLRDVHRSHRKAIDLLHDRDVERVNDFVERVVVPKFVGDVLQAIGPRLAADIAKASAPGASDAERRNAVEEMRKVVTGISGRIEKQRRELQREVEAARRARLQELDMAYAQLQQANAAITAHLASVTKVNALQDDLLAKAGLKDFREKVGDTALEADQRVENALGNAKDAEEALKSLRDALSRLRGSAN